MSVHKEISAHVSKQNKIITEFLALDEKREAYIEEAALNCKSGKLFTPDKINKVTTQINELAKQGIIPTRKYVTSKMIEEYVQKLK